MANTPVLDDVRDYPYLSHWPAALLELRREHGDCNGQRWPLPVLQVQYPFQPWHWRLLHTIGQHAKDG